jgi:acyl CoA:acetate/3-ketoacid CoA transferase beta subunit
VFEVQAGGQVLKELHPGVSLEDVTAKTGSAFKSAL